MNFGSVQNPSGDSSLWVWHRISLTSSQQLSAPALVTARAAASKGAAAAGPGPTLPTNISLITSHSYGAVLIKLLKVLQ